MVFEYIGNANAVLRRNFIQYESDNKSSQNFIYICTERQHVAEVDPLFQPFYNSLFQLFYNKIPSSTLDYGQVLRM